MGGGGEGCTGGCGLKLFLFYLSLPPWCVPFFGTVGLFNKLQTRKISDFRQKNGCSYPGVVRCHAFI